jgi:protein-L-isoaspartate(D-aspartate) O-methyltransferase
MNNRYYLMQKNMVEYQIKSRGINNSSILDVFLKVPRHQFVNEEVREYAYQDHPLGIGYNQTISQPYIVAFMIDYLDIKDTDKVLEIGTGSGYQTAILAELAYKVFTLEIVKPLQDKAKKILTELNYNNIYYSNHSGFDGWIEHAPFDKIIVSAAPNKLPDHLVDQLKIGGRMILPIGEGWFQRLYLIIKHQNSIEKIKLDSVRFVPMIEK